MANNTDFLLRGRSAQGSLQTKVVELMWLRYGQKDGIEANEHV